MGARHGSVTRSSATSTVGAGADVEADEEEALCHVDSGGGEGRAGRDVEAGEEGALCDVDSGGGGEGRAGWDVEADEEEALCDVDSGGGGGGRAGRDVQAGGEEALCDVDSGGGGEGRAAGVLGGCFDSPPIPQSQQQSLPRSSLSGVQHCHCAFVHFAFGFHWQHRGHHIWFETVSIQSGFIEFIGRSHCESSELGNSLRVAKRERSDLGNSLRYGKGLEWKLLEARTRAWTKSGSSL